MSIVYFYLVPSYLLLLLLLLLMLFIEHSKDKSLVPFEVRASQ